MATEQDLRKLERAFSQPASWKYTGTLGSLIATLPRVGGQSALRVIGGREEEMMNGLGYDTAWTDGVSITFTSKFLDNLTDLGLAFVLLHECGHVAFKHMSRRRSRDPYNWNIAGDIKINDTLARMVIPNFLRNKEFNASMMFVNKKPLGIGFTKSTEKWLDDFRPYMEEEIHYLLEEEMRRRRQEDPKQAQQGQQGQGKGQQGQGKGQGKGQSQGSGQGSPGGPGGSSQGQGGQGSQAGSAKGFDFGQAQDDAFDDHIESGMDLRTQLEEKYGEEGRELADSMNLPETEAAQEAMDAASARALTTARQLSRSANKSIGGHVDGAIEEAIEVDRQARARYNWAFEITGALQEAMMGHWRENIDAPDELSQWSRIPELSAVMGVGEIFRPDMYRKMGMGNVLVVQDTSGSMSQEDIKLSMTELKGMCENNRIRMTFVSADTESRDRIVFEPEDLLEFPTHLPIKGRGGTDMLTPVVQEICAAEKPYDMCVLFTDGYFYAYDYATLVKEINKVDPSKVQSIPPIAYVITTDYYDNPELNAAARTFPDGRCRVFGITDPLLRGSAPEISVTQDGMSVS